jgi:hypothetical protein
LTTIDYIKLAMVLPLFLVLAPLGGLVLKGRPSWQRMAFALLCFMTLNGLMGPGNWGLTLGSIEAYRGHTKGYHFYFNHAIAIALISARWLEDRRSFRWMPPGLALYLLYCAISVVSVVNAPSPNLVWMAAHKMIFASVLLIAAFNLLRTDSDLRFFLRVMVWVMTWELFVCLKLKYMDGMYQVRGTFEHQNPLAMFSVLIGMIFLATGLGPAQPESRGYVFGFLVCAAIVQSTLSRGALGMYAMGSVLVVAVSLAEKLTVRRLVMVVVLGLVGAIGLVLALDTIVSRFNDHGNAASGQLREVMNRASMEMVRDHPLGIGWNNYALVVNPPYRYAEIYFDWNRERGMAVDETKANAVVESHYYLLIAETGWLGFGSYCLMIVVGLWWNLKSFLLLPHSFRRTLALGIATGCALNYAQSSLERVLVQPRNLMLWLVVAGVTGRMEVMRRDAARRKAEA